jgi:hypothetical protein
MQNHIAYLNEWLQLARSGNFEKAEEIYFEKLFTVVIENFREKHKNILPKGGVLFSILGLSPEPVILTASIIEPEIHVIFTTNNQNEGNEYLKNYLPENYEMVYLPDEKFDTAYKAMKEQLFLNHSSKIILDITGGKKSIVASAAIFGKDYGCTIVYVDFTEYIKDLRKPMPGSEVLQVVYNRDTNQPELFIK